jgi:hypothetical protein
MSIRRELGAVLAGILTTLTMAAATRTVPGTDVRARGYAITADVKTTIGPVSETATETFRSYRVGKRWKWVMNPDLLDRCMAADV